MEFCGFGLAWGCIELLCEIELICFPLDEHCGEARHVGLKRSSLDEACIKRLRTGFVDKDFGCTKFEIAGLGQVSSVEMDWTNLRQFGHVQALGLNDNAA